MKKSLRTFGFRTHAAEITEWNHIAKQQHKPLSVFLREAAHAHKAGLTQEQLNAHLVEMRRVLNAALQVRTVEQKNHRIEVVRDHLTKMLHRDSRSRNPWGI